MVQNIIVIDDHPLIRISLISMLKNKYSNTEIHNISNGVDGLLLAEKCQPELILIDVEMPHMNGIEFLKKIRLSNKTVKIILITGHIEEDLILISKKLGANGYITKDLEPETITYLVEQVITNNLFIIPHQFYDALSQKSLTEFDEIISAINELTDRELHVFRCLYQGMKNKEIADLLNITIKSTENYKNRISNKLACNDLNINNLITQKQHIIRFLV